MPRLLLALLVLAASPSALAQPSDDLDADTQERLRIEIREMDRADQRARYMTIAGTFSPCVADSVETAHSQMELADGFAADAALRAEAEARLSQAERDQLQAMQLAVDDANIARLREIIETWGWPTPERIGGDVEPFVFLLHTSPDTLETMLPLLRREVDAGRLPAMQYAGAVDKGHLIRRRPQLYGTASQFDHETQTVGPPRIGDIETTNAARAEIGLPPLTGYVEVWNQP